MGSKAPDSAPKGFRERAKVPPTPAPPPKKFATTASELATRIVFDIFATDGASSQNFGERAAARKVLIEHVTGILREAGIA